jgi:hypothetical protein
MRYWIFIVVSIFFLNVAVFSQANIHSVDFKNFTYRAYCAGEDPDNIRVKDGEYSKETQQDGYVDRIWFKVFSINYGDLNGDKQDEAVVLSVCNTGGTGNFSEGFIYSMKAGKPVLAARIPGGDRAFGGLRDATIDSGILTVERNDAGEDGGACCPQFILTEHYKLTAGKINQIGKADRRPVVPTERILFAKGSSGKTFKTTIPAGEAKHFVVGARGGQNLSVSVNSDKVSLRLIEDAQVTDGVNSFSAKLPKNGDYTIELENTAAIDVDVTVNIKIQ